MQNDFLIATILNDIEEIHVRALEKGNLATALRAKELLGRHYGLFLSTPKRQSFSLKDLTDEEIQNLIREIESQQTRDEEEN